MGWELVRDSKQCKCWLDLDEIEIYTDRSHKVCRNWKNSIGKKIGTRYQWMNDEVEEKWFVIKEDVNCCLTLVDENNEEFKINSCNLCKGKLGKIFDRFKYDIGDIVNNLIILNKEYRKDKRNRNIKWYQYQCINCENVDWICEYRLKEKKGCNVCANRKVIKGINDIATTNPELCKYFVNQEDIYTHTANSGKKVLLKCPDCGYPKEMTINTLNHWGFGCNKCSNGKSYPEKFMVNVLIQLNIRFITELNRTTFDWCQNFRYDFYLPDDNRIIETNGPQHYRDTLFATYEETHKNDLNKRNVAILNVSDYIVIDSRHSTLEWMKENIIKELGHLYDLSNVDWEMADKESQHSHMILSCQLKRENQDLTIKEIVELIKEETGIKYTGNTIRRWLNNGNELGLCYYNGKEEMLKARKGENHPQATLIDRFDKQGNLIDTKYQFEYVQMGFNASHISSCCTGRRKSHKGYIFKYHEE